MTTDNSSGQVGKQQQPLQMWYTSYRERHIIADNLGTKSAMVSAMPPIYNSSYCASFTILQGSMLLRVNGIDLQLRPNDYLVVMPCTTIELLESRCVFFSETILAHAVFDLYEEMNYNVPMQKRAFCFHLYHFSSSYIDRFNEVYLMVKREMLRPDYRIKDVAIRAFSKLYLTILMEALDESPSAAISIEMSRQQQLFDRFIELLDIHYTHERSVQFYAKKMNVSSKYLSMIAQQNVGTSASVVINQYVTFRIKQLLYRGQMSVKQVSELLNFPTQSFFGRYFKRIVGISPRQYMKKNSRNYNDLKDYEPQQ